MLQCISTLRCLYLLKFTVPWHERLAFAPKWCLVTFCGKILAPLQLNSFLLTLCCRWTTMSSPEWITRSPYIMEKEKLFRKSLSSIKFYNSPDKPNSCITLLNWSVGQIKRERAGNRWYLKTALLLKKIYVDHVCWPAPFCVWGSFKNSPESAVNVCLRT